MSLFGRRKRQALGIDIGSAAVKVLEMSAVRGGYRADRCALEPLPRNAVVEHGISDLKATSEAVRRAVSNSRSARRNAVVAVSQTHVVSRTITLPADLTDREMEEQVMIEATQQIPYPLDEINLDYRVTGGARSGSDDEVMITACRKEIVEDYIAVMELAGLRAVIVDVGLFAMERSFEFVAATLGESLEGRAIALMDFGDVSTRLDLFLDGNVIYSRDQNFGGRILTENIRSRYGIDYREAEALKRTGDLPQNYEEDLLGPFRQAMAREAARGVEFCLSARNGLEQVDALLICGGCCQIPGVAPLIEAQVGVPTLVADLFGPGSGVRASKLVQRYAPSMIKAAGLAVRGVG
jgi:type IV pilus assembly protein PilM